MDELRQEDPFDRQLREAAPYIDDGGFTTGVLRRLPPPQRSRRRLRAVILLGTTLLASVLGYVFSDNGRFITVTIERLATLPPLLLCAFALISGMFLIVLGLVAAMTKSHEG